jgi:hypothetical protein
MYFHINTETITQATFCFLSLHVSITVKDSGSLESKEIEQNDIVLQNSAVKTQLVLAPYQ